MEIIFLLIWKMRQDIEFQKQRANMQAQLNQKGAEPKHIEEAFADLRAAFFPFEKNQKKQEMGDMRQAMLREIARGALSVIPTVDPDRGKMSNRIARGQEKLARRQAKTDELVGMRQDPTGPRRRPRVS